MPRNFIKDIQLRNEFINETLVNLYRLMYAIHYDLRRYHRSILSLFNPLFSIYNLINKSFCLCTCLWKYWKLQTILDLSMEYPMKPCFLIKNNNSTLLHPHSWKSSQSARAPTKNNFFFYQGQNIQRQPTSERCFNNQSKYVDLEPIFNFNFFFFVVNEIFLFHRKYKGSSFLA